ncbi:MAG TPA: Uma2 family endonuclease [Spirochaetes bacterium]|nr:Uma2 family endonuclease [Spirochaetota bacterium]
MALTKHKTWTYKDYCELDDDKQYEILEGELIEMPAPGLTHQRVLKKLSQCLDRYVEKNKMGELFIAPLDVIFDPGNTLEPDIIFVSSDRLDMAQDKGLFGSPDLVVEIVSPSSQKMDTVDKFKIYQKFKVKEYWIVHPNNKSTEVFILEKDRLLSFCIAKEKDKIKSKLFSNIDITFQGMIQ